MIINHNCCIKLVHLIIFLYDKQSHRHQMCKNNVELGRPLMTIWHMCFACWITKATNTYSQYITSIAFPLQQRLKEHASMLRYMYIARLFNDHYIGRSRFISVCNFSVTCYRFTGAKIVLHTTNLWKTGTYY
jgi:hypothetical protein